jgi:hypothetical protein
MGSTEVVKKRKGGGTPEFDSREILNTLLFISEVGGQGRHRRRRIEKEEGERWTRGSWE